MAQPYNTGPVALFAGVGSGNSPLFLGHGERGPRIQVRPKFSPVYCDLGGSVEIDTIYDGIDAIVSVTLTRFNHGVLRTCMDRGVAFSAVSSGLEFIDDPGEMGTLMATENRTFQLWLLFPHAAKGAMAGTGTGNALPRGFRFTSSYMLGPDDHEVGNSTPYKVHCVFHCLRELDMSLNNGLGQGRWTLADRNMAGLPAMD